MILVAIFVFLLILYIYSTTKNNDYWKKKGITYIPPLPILGSNYRNIFGLISLQDYTEEIYKNFPTEKAVGYFRGRCPELLVRDLDIARQILNTDFGSFHKRGFGRNPKVEPLQYHLFSAEGDSWKLLRQRQTPIFTTAKLKSMFPLILKCAEKLYGLGDRIIARGGECDMKEIMARFATEFIGAVGFGLEMDTINEDKSPFRHMGTLVTNPPLKSRIMMGLYEFFPELRDYLYVDDPEIEKIIFEIVGNIRHQRNDKPIGRNDFIDLLLELQGLGKIKGQSIENFKPDGTPMAAELEMDNKVFAAQVFVFFAAGFETSSSTASYTLHELAYHPEIQERVQHEIDEVLLRHGNNLCYDAVAEMSYLEMCMKEAMRIFPPVAFLNRQCAKPCHIPQLDITLEPGTKILIPTQAIHHDEKYYDNPREYRPERFLPDEANARHKYAFLPFGEGPRMCIGARLGLMQSLAGLAVVLSKFTVEPATGSEYDLAKDPTVNLIQGVKSGIRLKLKYRKNYKIN